MIFKSIVTDGDEAIKSIKTFYFPEDFLKIRVKCISQISNETNEFPAAAAYISKIVYCLFLS